MITAPFEARYKGECFDCNEPIWPGQMIKEVDVQIESSSVPNRAYVHQVCPEPRRGEVCPVCFMEKSINGMCSCSDAGPK